MRNPGGKGDGAGGGRAFEEIEHTADRAFHIRGGDPAALFANAARALFCAASPPPAGAPWVEREIQVNGADRETLLVNWLNELLYLQETNGESYAEFQIDEISQSRLRGRVRGCRRPAACKIKAVTFHNLAVRQDANGWHATLVVDV